MQQEDKERLQHILYTAASIRRIVGDMTIEEFFESELHANTVVRYLSVIGEAAARLSDDFKNEHPEIPWHKITGMRNRLVHDYYDINLEAVYVTATLSVRQLEQQVRSLLDS